MVVLYIWNCTFDEIASDFSVSIFNGLGSRITYWALIELSCLSERVEIKLNQKWFQDRQIDLNNIRLGEKSQIQPDQCNFNKQW